MTRSFSMIWAVSPLFALAAPMLSAPAAAQDVATFYKSTEVAPGIYMLEGGDGFGGGNVGLLAGEDHVALIDDGLAPTAGTLLAGIEKIVGRPVDFIINTHVHGDHAGGNAHFAAEGAVIFAHDNIRKRLVANPESAGGAEGLPVVTFADGVTFHLNGIEARVHHFASAHTDGDSYVVFPEANVIQTGDLFFNGSFPFIDLDSGGSVSGYLEAQRELLELADAETVLVPGHGPLATRAELETHLAMLIDSHAKVQALVDDGLSADEVVAANPLAGYHEEYDWPFITTERMTRTLYRDIAGE
ncbi:MAG TPA: MBL fold metallo-hydrolase [Woeseiaceae bacterium]|nr:MBL fold metallo-hydrolase [Woeseiaceae bacterium]